MYHPRLTRLGLVLLLFAAGCSESGLTIEPAPPGDALPGMSGGGHHGIAGFYFLAPTVEDPAYSDTFPKASPLVDVCAIVNSLVSRFNSRPWSFGWLPSAVRCHGI